MFHSKLPLGQGSTKPLKHNISKLLKQKKKTYKQGKLDPAFKQQCKEVAKQYNCVVIHWHDKNESHLCGNPNTAQFYGYINRELKTRSYIPLWLLIRFQKAVLLLPIKKKQTCLILDFTKFSR